MFPQAWPLAAAAALCAALTLGCRTGAQTSDPPDGTAGRWASAGTCAPPKTDGRAGDDVWALAPGIGPFVGPFNPGERDIASLPEYRTEARMAWDPETLYFAFWCRGPGWMNEYAEHDDPLHKGDVAEVFLDLAGDMLEYAEFQASPRGVTADYYHVWKSPPSFPADAIDGREARLNHEGARDWDLPGFRAAAGDLIENGESAGWFVEMAVPVAEILGRRGLAPGLAAGVTFRANLIRYVHEPGPDGKRRHRHLNLGRTMKGCPHVSPMSMTQFRCTDSGVVVSVEP
jgi:hypothetical protein